MNGATTDTRTAGVLRPVSAAPLAYKAIQSDCIDPMPYVLSITGRQIEFIQDELPDNQPVVVNALDVAAHQVIRCLRESRRNDTVILTDCDNAERLQDYGLVVVLPCACGHLVDVLNSVTQNRSATASSNQPGPGITPAPNSISA